MILQYITWVRLVLYAPSDYQDSWLVTATTTNTIITDMAIIITIP
jgi:hypothetical protein